MDTVPRVLPLFWTLRIMAAIGIYLIAFFAIAVWSACKHHFQEKRWFLRLALWTLPLPWIAIECGWFVAEYGRRHSPTHPRPSRHAPLSSGAVAGSAP